MPAGERGEIVVRSRDPLAITEGYFRNPEATAAALRGGALHTGDLGAFDRDGNLFFHGRMSDSVRVKGENVSAWEVESVAAGHPAVEDCAMIGVAADIGEQDIKLFVTLKAGNALDPASLSGWLAERLAPYQVPRYVEHRRRVRAHAEPAHHEAPPLDGAGTIAGTGSRRETRRRSPEPSPERANLLELRPAKEWPRPGARRDTMCRNIRTLFNFEPPATEDEVRASALQFVRKLSGFNTPSRANAAAFDRAVEEVTDAARRLLDSLATTAPARDREIEAEKARARSRERFA